MVRSGRGSDGGQGDEFAEFVRHSLHAAADQVEPSPDGLQRIRDKIRSGPAYDTARASRAAASSGFLAALARRWHALRGQPTAPAGRRAKPGHARPAPQRPRDWREAILRPAFAVGFALFAVGVVLATVPTIRTTIGQSVGLISEPTSSGQASPLGGGQGLGTGSHASTGYSQTTGPAIAPVSTRSATVMLGVPTNE